MQKDFKIGLLVGLVLVICAALFISMHPGLSTRARIQNRERAEAERKRIESPRFEPNNLAEIEIEIEREKPEVEDTPRYHIVRNNETLSGISYQYYGTENQWQKIFNANRRIIKEPTDLRAGMRLLIPE
jgi:nucleoid-associated protein YgaU